MSEVVGRLDAHVHEDLVKCDVAPVPCPPRDLTGRIERQRLDGGIAVRGGNAVQFDNLLPRLVGGRPHVCVRSGAVGQPRQLHAAGPPEYLTEVSEDYTDGRPARRRERAGPCRYRRTGRCGGGLKDYEEEVSDVLSVQPGFPPGH
jgi:hypothetical protein